MKFVKSLSLPVLSLALLLPISNASGYEVKAYAHKLYNDAGEVVGRLAEKAQGVGSHVREYAGNMLESAKAQYNQIPSFEHMRAATVQKLGLENKGLKAAVNDAKDTVLDYAIRHPYVTVAAASAVAFGTGFWLARKLFKSKKTA